ncbi:MAG: HAD family hydrolase [Clostridia bacterium]|nr:HAD family hydrolase [Clostridia bacterium]
MGIKAVIWDLDGTLLDTLDDLTASTNAALASCGLPARTKDEVRRFVGSGVRRLMEQAVGEPGAEHPDFDRIMDAFVAHYGAHSRDKTAPYDGVMEMLHALSAEGIVHAIVSNKIDSAVKALSREYFGGLMHSSVGDDPSRRKKPAPDSVLEAMRLMGVSAQETVYVGDSDVDVITARNAGIPCIAVTWGFRDEACLRGAGAEHIAHTPQELMRIAETL